MNGRGILVLYFYSEGERAVLVMPAKAETQKPQTEALVYYPLPDRTGDKSR